MLHHIKTWKKSISKFHFPVKLYDVRKKVMVQNYFLHKDLQILTATFFHKMYIFLFNLKIYYWKTKVQLFLTIICEIRKKLRMQSYSFQKDLQFLSNTVSDKTYIFRFNCKKYDWNLKIPFFRQNMWDTKKRLDVKLFA